MNSVDKRHYFISCFDVLGVEFAKDSEDDDAKRDCRHLVATSDECREEHGMSCWAEDVAMHLLPTVFVTQVALL